MAFRAERTKGNPRGDQLFPDIGDAFHLFQRNADMAFGEIEQITQAHRPGLLNPVAVFFPAVVNPGITGVLQGMDDLGIKGMGLTRFAQTEETANRQNDPFFGPGLIVEQRKLAFDPGQAKA